MKYFKCKWLKDLPKDTYLRTNMCLKYSTTSQSVSLQYSTAAYTFRVMNDRNVKVSTQITYRVDYEFNTKPPNLFSMLVAQRSKENLIYAEERGMISSKTEKRQEFNYLVDYIWYLLLHINHIDTTLHYIRVQKEVLLKNWKVRHRRGR